MYWKNSITQHTKTYQYICTLNDLVYTNKSMISNIQGVLRFLDPPSLYWVADTCKFFSVHGLFSTVAVLFPFFVFFSHWCIVIKSIISLFIQFFFFCFFFFSVFHFFFFSYIIILGYHIMHEEFFYPWHLISN